MTHQTRHDSDTWADRKLAAAKELKRAGSKSSLTDSVSSKDSSLTTLSLNDDERTEFQRLFDAGQIVRDSDPINYFEQTEADRRDDAMMNRSESMLIKGTACGTSSADAMQKLGNSLVRMSQAKNVMLEWVEVVPETKGRSLNFCCRARVPNHAELKEQENKRTAAFNLSATARRALDHRNYARQLTQPRCLRCGVVCPVVGAKFCPLDGARLFQRDVSSVINIVSHKHETTSMAAASTNNSSETSVNSRFDESLGQAMVVKTQRNDNAIMGDAMASVTNFLSLVEMPSIVNSKEATEIVVNIKAEELAAEKSARAVARRKAAAIKAAEAAAAKIADEKAADEADARRIAGEITAAGVREKLAATVETQPEAKLTPAMTCTTSVDSPMQNGVGTGTCNDKGTGSKDDVLEHEQTDVMRAAAEIVAECMVKTQVTNETRNDDEIDGGKDSPAPQTSHDQTSTQPGVVATTPWGGSPGARAATLTQGNIKMDPTLYGIMRNDLAQNKRLTESPTKPKRSMVNTRSDTTTHDTVATAPTAGNVKKVPLWYLEKVAATCDTHLDDTNATSAPLAKRSTRSSNEVTGSFVRSSSSKSFSSGSGIDDLQYNMSGSGVTDDVVGNIITSPYKRQSNHGDGVGLPGATVSYSSPRSSPSVVRQTLATSSPGGTSYLRGVPMVYLRS